MDLSGIKVFPDFNIVWYFDVNVVQKYLLEAINAQMVPSHGFCDIKEAIDWANLISYPKVFKLKEGEGSANVKLVKTKSECIYFINKSFAKDLNNLIGKPIF